MKKLKVYKFIEKCRNIHGDKYDYSKVNYVNNNTIIDIICPSHGIFKQIPRSHLTSGCSKCAFDSYRNDIKLLKQKIINIHGYNISYISGYKNMNSKVLMNCSDHGNFQKTPTSLLRNYGCNKCKDKLRKLKYFLKFKQMSRIIHNNKYDYSLSIYIGTHKKMNIICPDHGVWKQTPKNHLSGRGCFKCKESKGEKKITKLLKSNNIKHVSQKTFSGCVYKKPLRFDFYIPEYNLCVEYNGRQHSTPIDFFGGLNEFNKNIIRDNIKKQYCKNNDIKLLIINYDENIVEKLKLNISTIS